MGNPDVLFRGIPRGPTRAYSAKVLAQVKAKRVVIPCTGSFSLAATATEAGVPPDRIFAGDISLYSTAIGNAIMGTDWEVELIDDGEIGSAVKSWMDSPARKAAAVLFALRTCQYSGAKREEKLYYADRKRELLENADCYLGQMLDHVLFLAESLKGVTYVAQDMWKTMAEELDEPGTVHLCNPPRYSGGYIRMFAGLDQIFRFQEPEAKQFMETDYVPLMKMLAEKPVLTLMYYATPGEDPAPLWGPPWRSVFADRPAKIGAASINWIIANEDPAGIQASRGRIVGGKGKYPMMQGEIRSGAVINGFRMDKQTGDYYRDLLIHRLEGSLSEIYAGINCDGKLLGVIGVHMHDLHSLKKFKRGEKVLERCIAITFAFTCPNDVYTRLHKLTLMCAVSSWFWEDLFQHEQWFTINGGPKNVKSTMLTDHPENKTARGIMALDSREKQKDGSYKLAYSAAIIDRTREETVKEWQTKFGAQKK